MTSHVKTLISIGVGVLLAISVFAVIIQITDTEEYRTKHIDPASGLSIYNENSSYNVEGGCFRNTVQINNLGFHSQFVSPQKGKDVFRILIIGSSLIEARQVRVEDMYSTLLQNKLNADPNKKYTYEVIPMGVGGNKLLSSVLYYVWYGSKLKPDLVISFETQYELIYSFGAFSTDAQGNAILEVPKVVGNPVKARIRDELHRFKLLVNVYNRYLVIRDAVATFLAHPFFFIPQNATAPGGEDLSVQASSHWPEQKAVIGALASRVRSDGTRLLLTSWFIPDIATSTMGEFPIRLGDIATKNHIPYADLLPAFKAEEATSGESPIWACDVHWTPAGNRYMAEALYRYLTTHSSLIMR